MSDWITYEHAKDLVLLGLFLWTHGSTTRQIRGNTVLTRKVGVAVDFGNDVTVAIAEKEGSLPPPALDDKPRPRAVTLDEGAFDGLIDEARRLDAARKNG